MINSVTLVGRLTKDPVLTYTPNGHATARFTLAVNRSFTGQNGEKQADFINILVWRKQAENVANYLHKGNLTGITGRIQTGSYEKDGKRIFTVEVVADSVQFLEPKNQHGNEQYAAPPQQQNQQYQSNQNYQTPQQNQQYQTSIKPQSVARNEYKTMIDDDLPF